MTINLYNSEKKFTNSALSDILKKELTAIKIDIEKYQQEIEKNKETENKNYYVYELDLDFSKDPRITDDRKYYNRAFHYQKIGLFKGNIPWLKISLLDLSLESLKSLSEFQSDEREYVAKQAIGRIFEDVNSDIYHNSISSILKVKFIDGSDYDYAYTIYTKENYIHEYMEEKKEINK